MIVFLIFLLIVCLLWTLINTCFLPKLHKQKTTEKEPPVSILIPLRDEETNVPDLCAMLAKLHYRQLEFIFLDDQSTDCTNDLLNIHTAQLDCSRIIRGKELPLHWVGKVYACQQLAENARGDFLFFLDADIRIEPSTIHKLVAMAQKRKTGLISGFPHFPVSTFLGRLLVPMQHFLIYVHLPLALANYTKMPIASAAHGSFMFFKKEAYIQSGMHKAVASSLTEDVHLMRNIKKAGYKGLLVNNTHLAKCYMYETNKEVWNGFTKNSYPGIGRSFLLALTLMLFYSIMFISPLFFASYAFLTANFLFLVPLIICVLIKGWIDWQTKQERWLSLLLPVSAASLIGVLSNSIVSSNKKGYNWKGRNYQ